MYIYIYKYYITHNPISSISSHVLLSYSPLEPLSNLGPMTVSRGAATVFHHPGPGLHQWWWKTKVSKALGRDLGRSPTSDSWSEKKSSETKETRKNTGQKFCGNGMKWLESGKILMLVRSGRYPKMINRMANESAAGTFLWRWWGKGWFYPVLSKLPPCNVGAKHVPRESNLDLQKKHQNRSTPCYYGRHCRLFCGQA